MNGPALEMRRIAGGDEAALAQFFALLESRGIDKYFHPHPFTPEAAHERATYDGEDLYFGLFEAGTMLGYAMLRGWDEGYEIPSLGIVIHPDAKGQGLGRRMMEFLRTAASRRGARTIRLRVYPDNLAAVNLYRSLGYQLSPEEDGRLWVGFLDLVRR